MKKIILFTILLISTLCYSQPKPIDCRTQRRNDSLEIQYLNYKIKRAQYYVRICNKNKSQTKFLSGWVTRALN
jgi:Predicted Peptidoglycan domain